MGESKKELRLKKKAYKKARSKAIRPWKWLTWISLPFAVILTAAKYSLQGTTQGRYLTGGVPPVRFSM